MGGKRKAELTEKKVKKQRKRRKIRDTHIGIATSEIEEQRTMTREIGSIERRGQGGGGG